MPEYLKWYYYCPASQMGDFGYTTVKYLKTEEISISCNEFIDLTVKTADFVDKLSQLANSLSTSSAFQWCLLYK